MPAPALLDASAITVRYGATTALAGVSLDVRAGEVHAVVGENGAGKSTLLRIMAGAMAPASGSITVARTARRAWVPQETELPADLTVAEWIFLGAEWRSRFGWLRRRAMRAAAASALQALGCEAAAHARVGTLSEAARKQVQLARALRTSPTLLLLDEPTAVLGDRETRALFAAVRDLRRRGSGILYVSHRLAEVMTIADRVTVLRDGHHVCTDAVAAIDVATLVHRMVGRDIAAPPRAERPYGETALQLTGMATAQVRDVSLTLRHGEIVGLAGLVGAGRSEVLEAAAGLRRAAAGRIERQVPPILIPEDRARQGLVPALSLRENLFLPADGLLLRPARERQAARKWIDTLRIRTQSADVPIASLSGGNQQKLLLARALRRQPRLLLLDEPTAGVDVGTKAEIHDVIRRLAGAGTAIMLASSDLPELLLLCDRIVAMRGGQCVGEMSAAEATEAQLAALITGASG